MKILYIITRADHGGAQVAVLDLIRNLPAGFEPVVAAGERGFLEEECRSSSIPFRFVPGLVQPMHPFQDLRALVHLTSLIRSEKPALVHTHTSKAGLLGRIAAWLTHTPSVFTAHTWSFDAGISRLQQLVSVPLEKFAAGLGGKIITVSDANSEKALSRSISSRNDLIRIWNGIPDCEFRAAPGSDTPFTIISVARMVPQKDFATLLRAVSTLEGEWQLELVGDGPDRTNLEAMTREHDLDHRVEFLGRRLDVGQLLSRADIFVLSSNWEGLPISILEAMRAGLPVISSNVGGVKEAVVDGVTGLVTCPQDSSDLRNAIQKLIDSPELMQKMGQAGRQRFERYFNIDAAVRKTLDVYAAVCGDSFALPVYVRGEELG